MNGCMRERLRERDRAGKGGRERRKEVSTTGKEGGTTVKVLPGEPAERGELQEGRTERKGERETFSLTGPHAQSIIVLFFFLKRKWNPLFALTKRCEKSPLSLKKKSGILQH